MTKLPIQNIFSVFAVFVIALALTLQTLFVPSVSAAQITERSLTLMQGIDGADANTLPDGGAQPGGNANHLFEFTLPTSGIQSIKFEYCTTAANSPSLPACVAPAGIDVSTATLGDEQGHTGFSFTPIAGGDTNDFYITRASATSGGSTAVSYRFDGVINPSTEGTFFVRITSHATTDSTGATTDSGTVAASTAEQIIIDGTMPESLVFCAGETIGVTSGVPDCAAVGTTDGTITFNQLFSPTDTATATSQMAASTNAGAGYVISVNGPTLTSGSNTIAGISGATGSASLKGVAQFGLNLRANSSAAAASFPGTSADIAVVSNGTNYHGRPVAGYDTADTFKFVSGNIVADSDFANDGTPAPTDAQIFTVSYIANVPGSQPAGTYTSTLTYICTPTF